MLNNAIRAAKTDGQIPTVDWLKSIKDRCMPQSKQEWSEEDERNLSKIETIVLGKGLVGGNRNELVDWLKSLRPQKQWKPSEEQLVSLKLFIERYPDYVYNKELDDLYNNLKAL